MANVNPKMKSYIWLQTVDGFIQEVEEEVVSFCPMIRDEICKTGMGYSKACPICLPKEVKPAELGLILDYCKFHILPGHSAKECKTFEKQFIKMDKQKLLWLLCAARVLELNPLVELCVQALDEQINEIVGLLDDLKEDEKQDFLYNFDDDGRAQLLNKVIAKRREDFEERQRLMNVKVEEETIGDGSMNYLPSFINGANRGTKGTKANKKKNKNRRKKVNAKDHSTNTNENMNKESSPLMGWHNVNSDIALESSSSEKSMMQNHSPVKSTLPNADRDDDLDPTLMEKIDWEVNDFERRLNLNFAERLREVLSFGHDSCRVSSSESVNGSTHSNN